MAGRRLTGFAAAAVAVAVATLITACDVRWETDPSPVPSPDPTTMLRDRLAASAAVVAQAADASAQPLAERAAQSADAHLIVLGGVYVAYPDAPPSPSPSPEPLPSLPDAIADARAEAATVAAQSTDPDLGFIAASIELEWALVEWASEAAAADAIASPDDSPAPSAAADPALTAEPAAPPSATDLPDAVLSELVLAHDEARFAYETLAAQEFATDRDAVLARAQFHGDRAEALATLVAVDPRTPLYQLRDADLTDPDARDSLARSLELDLGWRYASLMDGPTAADRAWLFDGAYDAYTAAGRTEGFTVGDVPTLPGLARLDL